jgi:hypothetical protein
MKCNTPQVCPLHDRKVPEVRFHMAHCYQLSNRPAEGLAHLVAAREAFELRQRAVREGAGEFAAWAPEKAKEELEDIQAVLDDLKGESIGLHWF